MPFAMHARSPIRQRHRTHSQFLGLAGALWVGIACGCSAAGSSDGASGSQSGAGQGGMDASGGATAGQSGLGPSGAGASSGLGDDAAPSGVGQGGAGASGASQSGGSAGASGTVNRPDGSSDAQDAAPDGGTPADAASDGQPSGKVSHRLLSGFSDRGRLTLLTKDGQIEWQYDVSTIGPEANDAWLLPSGNVVFAHVNGARELTPTKQVVWNYSAPAGSEVQSCQPLSNGNYLLGEAHNGGMGLLREVDATGAVRATITVNAPSALSAHNQFREVRKTPQGTYLVTYLAPNVAEEFDASGKLLRTFPCGSFVAVRLPEGNTLVSCGDAHRVIEVDPQNNVVWQITETEIPGNRLDFAAGLQRLANGNTVICNWPGHAGAATPPPQAFEVTPDKKVVWELNDSRLGWVSNVEVLDPEASAGGVVLR
jgi:hypothetical protein